MNVTLSSELIEIGRARAHNLKNLSVSIKKNSLTVVTGVSGSGKSSLVFDTLFAEGQRKYVESLSSYARQFLGKINKPDVDFIKGIHPAIAIQQKVVTRNSRSTVATTTEIFDYLRLWFTKIGKTFSPVSGIQVKSNTVDDLVSYILSGKQNEIFYITCDLFQSGTNSTENTPSFFLKSGFQRFWHQDRVFKFEELADLEKPLPIGAHLLIDRIKLEQNNPDLISRIYDSGITAFGIGNGLCHIISEESNSIASFSSTFSADGIHFEIPSFHFFSFNNPYGACKTCEGFGTILGISEDLVIPDKSLSVYEGCVIPWRSEKMQAWKNKCISTTKSSGFPIHKPYRDLSESELQFLWNGNSKWSGINGFFNELDSQSYKIQYRVLISRYRGRKTCPDCMGTRIRKDAGYVKVVPQNTNLPVHNIQEVLLMNVNEALNYFTNFKLSQIDLKKGDRILKEISNRLQCLSDVGLGYLSLNRASNSLSGGESQRINLATSLGSNLTGSLYILDEPSIGLHSRDTHRLIKVLKNLRDLGNTVVVVEHDEDIMCVADEIIDIGPLAGTQGGNLVAQGNLNIIKNSNESITGLYLSGKEKIQIPSFRRKPSHFIKINGAFANNIKNQNVKVPLHTITVVTGVSGSGKTTLVKQIVYPACLFELGLPASDGSGYWKSINGVKNNITQIEFIDQNPIGKSSRSNPVTYIKAFDSIRDFFAAQSLSKHRNYKPSQFSFNVEGGRCDTCNGEGEITIEMQFMADIKMECEVCKGLRFKEETLEIKYNNLNIGEILQLTVNEASLHFEKVPAIVTRLKPLLDVGLGYIKLGQSASTLSGGEAQRVKLASFLQKGGAPGSILFIFDEPTTGLHFHDISKLLDSFKALIHHGHSILIIEHNLDIIKSADYIIDLGPDAGDDGGSIIFEGTPEELVKENNSYTAKYLKYKF